MNSVKDASDKMDGLKERLKTVMRLNDITEVGGAKLQKQNKTSYDTARAI